MLDRLKDQGYEIVVQSHAQAIFEQDFPKAIEDIESTLADLQVPITEIIGSGGGESKGTQRMRRALAERGWAKTNFEIKKIVNGIEKESVSHEVDHVKPFEKGTLALEIEWNNKDPFFDRDLENFKRLHAEGAISAGVIVTRGTSLHAAMYDFVLRFANSNAIRAMEDLERFGIRPTLRQQGQIRKRASREKNPVEFSVAWADQFVSDKYGEATTHWRKLTDRVARGVGNPCPLVLIGIPAGVVHFDEAAPPEKTAEAIQKAAIENA